MQGELFTTLPQTPSQMVRGHPSPHFLLQSQYIWNEVVIGPRDNGFPGPIMALDGRDADHSSTDVYMNNPVSVNFRVKIRAEFRRGSDSWIGITATPCQITAAKRRTTINSVGKNRNNTISK